MSVVLVLAALTTGAREHAHAARHEPGSRRYERVELGVGRLQGSLATDEGGGGAAGLDGWAASLRVSEAIPVVPGFLLGGALGLSRAYPTPTDHPCCVLVDRFTALHVGVQADWYPSPRTGFHVRAGFAYTAGFITGLADESLDGVTWTIGLARDTWIAPRTRIGGALLLDVSSFRGAATQATGLTTMVPTIAVSLLRY